MNYTIKHTFPSNEEFNSLFSSVGWGTRNEQKINNHRKASCFSACVYLNKQIVGMARIVGDGSYYTIYDVVVKQNHQKQGIEKF